MLTIFSTPKPFAGPIDVIQKNAIRSWQRLHPDVQVILVGDDEGTAQACEGLGVEHIKDVRRNALGTKYLASVYYQAEERARHKILCHVNCDIVLMSDFWQGVQKVLEFRDAFLMAGRRWDVDINSALNFDGQGWEAELRRIALSTNKQRPAQWIDYFVFPKGLYTGKLPEFLIGRPGWDNWLLWYPLSIGIPVVDASKVVLAVHQNHDYSYHPDGGQGVWYGEEAQHNYGLLRAKGEYETLESASYVISDRGLKRRHRRQLAKRRREFVAFLYSLWFIVLNITRPLRRALGLSSARPLRQRRLVNLVVVGIPIAVLLWWVWNVFIKYGEVPAGRGW
jgi:hypothetical protein